MELDVAIKLIKKHTAVHTDMCVKADKADEYYKNKTDILQLTKKEQEENALRNADNRVTSSFYSLLVNQKASYMFTAPPLFDVGNKSANDKIVEVLGDKYARNCKRMCIYAANGASAWIHYWVDSDNNFRYGILKAQQVIPIYSDDLDEKLLMVLRVYQQIDDETGKAKQIYEIWTDKECSAYCKKIDEAIYDLQPYNMFSIYDTLMNDTYATNVYKHNFEQVPFIHVRNNDVNTSDLESIKGLIDTYDKTYSGFANDLEDIQEIIFVLSGYEGTSLSEFMQNLKKYKTVKLDGDGDTNSGLNTLTIDIPVEARDKLLSMTRKAIFEQGQGVDPDPQNFGNASGVALKYLYSLLELKAGLFETECKIGFSELIRAICKHYNLSCDKIIQTWTRTSISNDTELADIATKSKGIVSDKTIIKNHPWVEDAEQELKDIEKEEEENMNKMDSYNQAFANGGGTSEE